MKTAPTPPAAESALTAHTPLPWFVHRYQNKEQSGLLFSIGSDGHRLYDGTHVAIAAHIINESDARFIVTAVNAHAAAQQRIALLEWAIDNRANVVRLTGTDEWELYFPSDGLPTAQGISRDDVIIKARAARLALRHPERA